MAAHDDELSAALLTIRYRLAGPGDGPVGDVGPAGDDPEGTGWAVEHLDGGDPGLCRVVRMPDPPGTGLYRTDRDAASARRERWAGVDRLAGVHHPHLEQLLAVADLDGDRRVVVVGRCAGMTLGTLLARRPPLAEAEVVTLVVPLAGALAALHDAGLAHGAVSPDAVVLGPDGRPVLVGVLDAVLARGVDVAGAKADVRHLVETALAALEPTTEGTAEPVRAALIAGMDGPAAGLAQAVYAALSARPIDMSVADVVAPVESARVAPRSGADVATVRPRGRRRGSRRRRRPAPGVRSAAAGAAALVVLAAVVWGLAAHRADDPGAGSTAVETVRGSEGAVSPTRDPVLDPADPVSAAVALSRARAEVLVGGDPVLLATVEVAGASAHVADAALLDRMRVEGRRIDGLTLRVDGAALAAGPGQGLDDAGAGSGADGDPAREVGVVLTSATSAYRLLGPDGAVERTVPASAARTVLLALRWTADGWRVTDVRAGP